MNYRHAFHAGNHADVLKHVVLLAMLDALLRKEAPFFVLDTHAGRGRYLLRGEAAGRTGEATTGILPLLGLKDPPPLLARYLRAVAADNPVDALLVYPGSPLLTELLVRPDDSPLRLNGSGMAIVNPPWKLDEAIAPVLPVLGDKLGERGASTRLEWLKRDEG